MKIELLIQKNKIENKNKNEQAKNEQNLFFSGIVFLNEKWSGTCLGMYICRDFTLGSCVPPFWPRKLGFIQVAHCHRIA